MGARKALCKPRLALSETKLAQPPGSTGSTGTKLSLPPGSTGSTGTKLSRHAPKRRFRPSFRAQGELFTAFATNNPSRENFIPHAGPLPVQNSPGTPQNADFDPLFARRENFLPLPPPTTRAGRTLSRMQSRFRYKTLPASGFDRPTRYKTLPASGLGRPTRYKTLPASPKTPISAHLSHAGRTLYRFRHQHDEHGEKSHAPTPHLSPATCPSPNFARNSIA